MKKLYALFLLLILSYQCTSPSKKTTPTKEVTTSTIKYANGFDIRIENGEKLIVKRVFQKGNKTTTYTLGATTDIEGNSLQVPVKNIVVTSTSHIPMLELLQAEKRIVGFPNTRYISSEKTRQRIADGLIVDLGSERSMNTEKLLELTLLWSSVFHCTLTTNSTKTLKRPAFLCSTTESGLRKPL